MLSHIALFITYNHSVKPWPDDCNIVAAKCCKVWPPYCVLLAPNLTIFKLELTTHMLQHVTTKWPTVQNMLCPTMLLSFGRGP